MKIAIVGYSGSGKSTLARKLAEQYRLPVLHFDTVQFLPNWVIRDEEEKAAMTKAFMDENDAWVIDGNYSKLSYERRMEEADVIIQLRFNRFSSLWRVTRRYLTYKENTRPDMAQGCKEKLDGEFIAWVLWKGRTRKSRKRYEDVRARYPEKTIVVKNQRQLNKVQQQMDKRLETASN